MSDRSLRGFRTHALAAATAAVLSASMFAAPAFAAGQVHTGGLQSASSHDRFIVKYREGSAERADVAKAKAGLSRAATAANGTRVQHLHRMALGADVVKSDRKLDRVQAESLMRQIAADPNVEYVEVDRLNKPLLTPNDTNFSQQFGFGTGAGGTYATQAWDITSGAGTVVAVLDTGITSHTDLNANVLPGYDFIIDTAVSNDGNGRDSDASDPGDWTTGQCGTASNSSWHGTHVAGTIAAVTNNAKGVAGMAYNAKIVPVRVLGTCGGYDSDIADAMIWASGGTVSGVPANANPAEVINLSLGGSGACGATSQAAINSAVSRGTTLVIAAGNDNANVSGSSPANCLNVVAVGATTSTGARSSFSNYGVGVDVAAPGSTIMSTMNAGTTSPGAESYVNYSGTSMATPHVAGIVALMQAVATTPKTPAEIESLLKSTARAFPVTQTQLNGSGIANAKNA
ncbi:MAG TPA: S8 family peptidase, partial [Lysobacter sp.]